MFTEYDQEISGILQDLNLDDAMIGYSRMSHPAHGGVIQSSSSSAPVAAFSSSENIAKTRKSIGVSKGFSGSSISTTARTSGGRSRSLHFSAADMK